MQDLWNRGRELVYYSKCITVHSINRIVVTRYIELYEVIHVYFDRMDQKNLFELSDNSSYTTSSYAAFTVIPFFRRGYRMGYRVRKPPLGNSKMVRKC